MKFQKTTKKMADIKKIRNRKVIIKDFRHIYEDEDLGEIETKGKLFFTIIGTFVRVQHNDYFKDRRKRFGGFLYEIQNMKNAECFIDTFTKNIHTKNAAIFPQTLEI